MNGERGADSAQLFGPRPRTVVYIKQAGQRHHVFVRYPGAAPTLLLSCPTEDEAVRAARGYAAKYYWLFDQDES